jgi:O-antigen/teichoic acid export membrane protein
VAAHAAWALALAFLPLFTRLRAEDRLGEVARWTGVFLRALSAAGVIACLGAVLLGEPLVAGLVGDAFRPAAALLPPIALALLAYLAAAIGRVLTLTLDRPRLALAAALASALVLVALGAPLAARLGPRGVAWALAAAAATQAIVLLAALRRAVPLGVGRWLGVLGLGAVVGGAAWLPVDAPPARMAVFATAVTVYLAALVLSGLVTSRELSALRSVLGRQEVDAA